MKIYTDGASRGNPGESAIAYLIIDNNRIIEKGCEKISISTNNEAEYLALINALKEVKKYSPKEVICYSDSNLLINQLNDKWKVKAKNLIDFYNEIKNLEKEIGNVKYVHVSRENKWIKICDKMANDVLDGKDTTYK